MRKRVGAGALLALTALVVVFGVALIGCANGTTGKPDTTDENGGEKAFTLSAIPSEYNEKYITLRGYVPGGEGRAAADGEIEIIGCQSYDAATKTAIAVKITNESADIPLWYSPDGGNTYVKYTGSQTADQLTVMITETNEVKADTKPLVVMVFASIDFSNDASETTFDESEVSSIDGGIFTLTDIPAEFNGGYVILEGFIKRENKAALTIFGAESYKSPDDFILAKISGGSALIPIWSVKDYDDQNVIYDSYSGSDTFTAVEGSYFHFWVYSSAIPEDRGGALGHFYLKESGEVVFSEGSAAISFDDFELNPYGLLLEESDVPAEYDDKYILITVYTPGGKNIVCQSDITPDRFAQLFIPDDDSYDGYTNYYLYLPDEYPQEYSGNGIFDVQIDILNSASPADILATFSLDSVTFFYGGAVKAFSDFEKNE